MSERQPIPEHISTTKLDPEMKRMTASMDDAKFAEVHGKTHEQLTDGDRKLIEGLDMAGLVEAHDTIIDYADTMTKGTGDQFGLDEVAQKELRNTVVHNEVRKMLAGMYPGEDEQAALLRHRAANVLLLPSDEFDRVANGALAAQEVDFAKNYREAHDEANTVENKRNSHGLNVGDSYDGANGARHEIANVLYDAAGEVKNVTIKTYEKDKKHPRVTRVNSATDAYNFLGTKSSAEARLDEIKNTVDAALALSEERPEDYAGKHRTAEADSEGDALRSHGNLAEALAGIPEETTQKLFGDLDAPAATSPNTRADQGANPLASVDTRGLFDDLGDPTQEQTPVRLNVDGRVYSGERPTPATPETWKDRINPGHWMRRAMAYMNSRHDGLSQDVERKWGKNGLRATKLALGAAAVGVLGYKVYAGVKGLHLGDTGVSGAANDLLNQPSANAAEGPVQIDHLTDAQEAAFTIPKRGGGYGLLDRLNVDEGVWDKMSPGLLKKFPDEFYRSDSGDVRIVNRGKLSPDAMKYIAQTARIWK
jgi:hypothetical protein